MYFSLWLILYMYCFLEFWYVFEWSVVIDNDGCYMYIPQALEEFHMCIRVLLIMYSDGRSWSHLELKHTCYLFVNLDVSVDNFNL